MRTWVTGGAGFLGSHLADALVRNGDSVVIVDNFSTGLVENLAGNPARIERRSLQDPGLGDLLKETRPELIFHLAGDALVARSVADPVADCNINLFATLSLLEAVRKEHPEAKILFASTGAVYGAAADRPFSEDDGLFPPSPYAASKLAAERYCFAYARTYGLRTCSLRLFSVYGPRQRKQVVYDLLCKLQADSRRLPLFGDGTQERDFSHAGDIVEAFLLAASRAVFEGEVFNVAGDEVVTIRGLAEELCRILEISPEFAFTGATRPGDSQRWVADTARLKALGYIPKVRLSDGLRDTVEWFLRTPR